MTIFVSTGGDSSRTAIDRAYEFLDAGISDIELSGGSFDPNWRTRVQDLSKRANLVLHNYYPVPEDNFVLNLASPSEIVVSKSLAHYQLAILTSSDLGARYFAIHAGMAVDPLPDQLGGAFSQNFSNAERSAAERRFMENVVSLSQFAAKLGVRLLIENHVLLRANFHSGTHPLLLVHPNEITDFFTAIDGHAGLLLDVGHLRVSSKTMGFDEQEAISALGKVTEGLHLHSNNGLSDQHLCLPENDPILETLGLHLDYVTLEIGDRGISEIVANLDMIKKVVAR